MYAPAAAHARSLIDPRAPVDQLHRGRLVGTMAQAGAALRAGVGHAAIGEDADHAEPGEGLRRDLERGLGAGGGAGETVAHMAGAAIGSHDRGAGQPRPGLLVVEEHGAMRTGLDALAASRARGEKICLRDRPGRAALRTRRLGGQASHLRGHLGGGGDQAPEPAPSTDLGLAHIRPTRMFMSICIK